LNLGKNKAVIDVANYDVEKVSYRWTYA
jgi:hypothetical protein